MNLNSTWIALAATLYSFIYPNTLPAQSEAMEALGERLFNEQRFAQKFEQLSNGDANFEISTNIDTTHRIQVLDQGELPSPFAGQTVSCATCHMLDQGAQEYGIRGYNDFAAVTKIPSRNDHATHTTRNTPSLIGIGSAYLNNRFSHYDGEFSDHNQTILGNFTGRNMGWLLGEEQKALKNIVNIIKNDNGRSELAKEFGGSYKKVLLGLDQNIPEEFRLSETERIDVNNSSDATIINKVVEAVSAYLNGIDFEKNDNGEYVGSPYDKFLIKNNIRTNPKNDESNIEYNHYLRTALQNLTDPKWIEFKEIPTHKRSFGFGPNEFSGLKKFFNLRTTAENKNSMCINCHHAPLFSDQNFHNVGTIQNEYDSIHGVGSFQKLNIPTLSQRKNLYLNQRPTFSDATKVDLGLYNFMFRENKAEITSYVKKQICPFGHCSDEEILSETVARVKTPSLRNLGHSAPYLHNGSSLTLKEVLDNYRKNSQLSRDNRLRNGDRILKVMDINETDIHEIELFLNSLNENYE